MKRTDFYLIENIIDQRIEEAKKEYELDAYDIREIRAEVYRENGWNHDPDPFQVCTAEEMDESVENTEYRDMADRLFEIGMSERDFF